MILQCSICVIHLFRGCSSVVVWVCVPGPTVCLHACFTKCIDICHSLLSSGLNKRSSWQKRLHVCFRLQSITCDLMRKNRSISLPCTHQRGETVCQRYWSWCWMLHIDGVSEPTGAGADESEELSYPSIWLLSCIFQSPGCTPLLNATHRSFFSLIFVWCPSNQFD